MAAAAVRAAGAGGKQLAARVAPAVRKNWATQASAYAAALAGKEGAVDPRFAELAEAGDLAGLRAHLEATRPTLDAVIAEFGDKKDAQDQVKQIAAALNEMHAAQASFWKDKPLRAAPLAKEDYAVFKKHIMTPGIVDEVEAAANKALAGDDKALLESHGSLSAAEKRRLAAITAAGETSLEEFRATLAERDAYDPNATDPELERIMAMADELAAEAKTEIAEVDEELAAVQAERDNLLYAVVEDELAADPELFAELQQDVIDNNWDPEPEQEESSPASGASMPW